MKIGFFSGKINGTKATEQKKDSKELKILDNKKAIVNGKGK